MVKSVQNRDASQGVFISSPKQSMHVFAASIISSSGCELWHRKRACGAVPFSAFKISIPAAHLQEGNRYQFLGYVDGAIAVLAQGDAAKLKQKESPTIQLKLCEGRSP